MEVCDNTRAPKQLQINIPSNNNTQHQEAEVTCLSPSSPRGGGSAPSPGTSEPACVFAAHLQMKLKSHLQESSSSSSEFFSNIPNEDSSATASEIFYDFDEVVSYGPDEELTSDYGTGGSNSTIVGGNGSTRSNSSSSSETSENVSAVGNNNVEVVNDEEEEEETSIRSVKYQRSSSLKSGKTPPGTPMKKIVRFADAMGLDLTDVKLFLDEIPRVPKEAYRDLHIPDYTGPTSVGSPTTSSLTDWSKPFGLTITRTSTLNFVPLFHQPVTMPDFFDKIRDQKVLLENAFLTQETVGNTAPKHVIKGTVRVMNLDFHKSVYVRYTYNDWKEFVDFQATYMPGSCDGFSDRFEFRIEIDETRVASRPSYLQDDAKVTFACRFHCQGCQFWDNNNSRNYVFQNVPTVTPAPAAPSIVSTPPRASSVFTTSSRYSSFDDYVPAPVVPPPNISSSDLLPQSCGSSSGVSNSGGGSSYSSGGGGGSHLQGSMYSPTSSFYEHAYGCYNSYGSACFY